MQGCVWRFHAKKYNLSEFRQTESDLCQFIVWKRVGICKNNRNGKKVPRDYKSGQEEES